MVRPEEGQLVWQPAGGGVLVRAPLGPALSRGHCLACPWHGQAEEGGPAARATGGVAMNPRQGERATEGNPRTHGRGGYDAPSGRWRWCPAPQPTQSLSATRKGEPTWPSTQPHPSGKGVSMLGPLHMMVPSPGHRKDSESKRTCRVPVVRAQVLAEALVRSRASCSPATLSTSGGRTSLRQCRTLFCTSTRKATGGA